VQFLSELTPFLLVFAMHKHFWNNNNERIVMTLTRWQRPELNVWSPFRHLSVLRHETDRLFDSPLDALTNNSQQFLNGWLPTIDVYEDRDNLVLKAELPGMKKEDIDIQLHGNVLTLSGERKEEAVFEKAETYRAERFLGKFQRSLTLPVSVDATKVQASYKDGILTVTLAKAEEAKPKHIEVKVS
jgi:HSP20 family protein